jgi:hypothetical protein
MCMHIPPYREWNGVTLSGLTIDGNGQARETPDLQRTVEIGTVSLRRKGACLTEVTTRVQCLHQLVPGGKVDWLLRSSSPLLAAAVLERFPFGEISDVTTDPPRESSRETLRFGDKHGQPIAILEDLNVWVEHKSSAQSGVVRFCRSSRRFAS